ncbi:hypothetical protein [Acuticoccus kandeliae]|uniref:hypothetical protein n=1 Tax=Acuticoccus kandeliae TaxID=2073160 RepID=UPI0013007EB7|nr:hypothetical protein [Acuticoccus kandeliae]
MLHRQVGVLRHRTENVFTAAGDRLVAALDAFTALERDVAGIAEFALSDHAARLAKAVPDLASRCARSATEVTDALAPIESIAGTLGDMRAAVAGLKRLLGVMRLMSLNAQVIACTTKAEDVDLGSIADSVQRVATQVETIGRDIGERLTALESDAARVDAGGQALGAHFGERMHGMTRALAGDLDGFTEELGDLTTCGGRLGEAATRVRGAVTVAVGAMQAGDAHRQRLDHVEAIFEAAGRGDTEERDAFHDLARLQLADALARHTVEVSRAISALREAETHIGTFREAVRVLLPAPGERGLALLAAVEEIEALLIRSREAQIVLDGDAAQLGASMRALLDAVGAFAETGKAMRYISFNSVIACVGLGEDGAAMRAVSEHLRTLAAEIAACRAELERQVGGLEEMWSRVSAGLARSQDDADAGAGAVASAIKRDLTSLGQSLTERLEELRQRNDAFGDVAAEGAALLGTHLGEVEALARAVDGWRVPGAPHFEPTEAFAARAAALRAVLSIECERTVHDEWAGAHGLAPPPPASPRPAAQDDISAILF